MKYIGKNLFFAYSEVRIIIIWMRTYMDYAIHIKVQIIKFWHLKNKTFNDDLARIKSIVTEKRRLPSLTFYLGSDKCTLLLRINRTLV